MTKVSIITPSYNSELTIERCIQSVKYQRNIDIEHVVIDGASVDQTAKIVNGHDSVKFFSEPDLEFMMQLIRVYLTQLATSSLFVTVMIILVVTTAIAKIVNKMQLENTDFAYADCIYVNNLQPTRYYKSGQLSSRRLSYGLAPAHYFGVASVIVKDCRPI